MFTRAFCGGFWAVWPWAQGEAWWLSSRERVELVPVLLSNSWRMCRPAIRSPPKRTRLASLT